MNKGVLAGLGPGDAPDVLTGDPGQNAVVVAGNRKEVSFSTTTAQAVAVTDCSDYRFVSVHIVSAGTSATQTFQASNDGVNWVNVPLGSASNLGNSPFGMTGSAGVIYTGPLTFRYFRINVAGISAGTTAGVIEFFSVPPPMLTSFVMPTTSSGSTQQAAVFNNTTPADALANSQAFGLVMFGAGYNGSTWDRLRTPTVFKTATATASGDTALWTPAAGKKFRLLRYRIDITANAALGSGAELDVVLRDATTATAHAMSVFVPTVGGSVIGMVSTGWVDLGNGQLSAANNNVLNINLGTSLSAGKVRVLACGTEE